MATVSFHNVGRFFDGVTALEDVSFDVADGEFIVLVGPSGCGKSTALRLVAGLDEPDTGRVCINGADMRGVAPKERGCAMVFQSYALYPHWSVFDNLAFPLRLKKTAKHEIERRVAEIASELRLKDVLQRRPKALSGGQRQRVALGRAMASNPEIFLFDEPLSNLDAPLRAAMRTEITARQKAMNKLTLYVTHDQAEALTMADRIVVLDQGHIQGIGPPEELYLNPPNRFVASFLGRPTINLLNVSVIRSEDRCTLSPLEWELTPEQAARIAHTGEIQVGIRPEHLTLSASVKPSGGHVDGCEFLGDKTQYRVRLGEQVVTVLSSQSETLPIGTGVTITPALDRLLFFDRVTGTRCG